MLPWSSVNMSRPAKNKRKNNFNSKWKEQFCFVSGKRKCVHLLCHASVSVNKNMVLRDQPQGL